MFLSFQKMYMIMYLVGAVNILMMLSITIQITDETIQKSGQDNSFSTMYDSFYKSFTDYNNDEATQINL